MTPGVDWTSRSLLRPRCGLILLVILFLVAGWNKLRAGSAAIEAYFTKLGVPHPPLAYYVALIVEPLPLSCFWRNFNSTLR
jgi:hypothetical protein